MQWGVKRKAMPHACACRGVSACIALRRAHPIAMRSARLLTLLLAMPHPTGALHSVSVEVRITADGTLQEICDDDRASLMAKFAAGMDVPLNDVSLTILPETESTVHLLFLVQVNTNFEADTVNEKAALRLANACR